jgi:hypothetical protein
MAENPITRTRWPFMFVTDQRGESTGWVVLHAPIQSPSRKRLFAEYREKAFRFVGMSSFMTFPKPDGKDPLDYEAVCEAWCHCFVDPDRFLSAGLPRSHLALSDFTSPHEIRHAALGVPRAAPRLFDFVYVGAEAEWKMGAKSWGLARRCIERLCSEVGLRGLVVGAPPGSLASVPRVTQSPRLSHHRFLSVLSRCGFLFVPSVLDASPRILAEALCLDVPIAVNRRIVGGWQYVAPSTGRFFDGLDDVADVAAACLGGGFEPRAWWVAHHGPERAGRTLRALLECVDPALGGDDTPLRISTWAGSATGDRD